MNDILSLALQVGALIAASMVVLSAAMVRGELARLAPLERSLAAPPDPADDRADAANLVERRATA